MNITLKDAKEFMDLRFGEGFFKKCIEYDTFYVFYKDDKSIQPGIGIMKNELKTFSFSPVHCRDLYSHKKIKEYKL